MTEPTDAELEAFAIEEQFMLFCDLDEFAQIARAVLAKWGTPPAVAPWRSAVLDLIDDCPGLTMEQDQWLSRRVKELDFASTPQPTQAQAGAVPLTDAQAQELIELESWGPDAIGLNAQLLRTIRRTEADHGIKGKEAGNADQ